MESSPAHVFSSRGFFLFFKNYEQIIHTLFILKSSSPDKRRKYLYPKPEFWNYPATPSLHASKDLSMNDLNQLQTQRWLEKWVFLVIKSIKQI